jgi:signal transduction histidine kinase
MLAAMSHDLRTSLTRLKLRLEIGPNPEQKQRMIAELDVMRTMIGSTLSFARDDVRREPRTLDLDTLIEGICDDVSDPGAAVTTYAGIAASRSRAGQWRYGAPSPIWSRMRLNMGTVPR